MSEVRGYAVPNSEIITAVKEAWEHEDPAAINNYLCRDQVAPYSQVKESTLKRRLRRLADRGLIASALSIDPRAGSEVRTFAPLEAHR